MAQARGFDHYHEKASWPSRGGPYTIETMLKAISTSGHGALDPVEGAVWRVEHNVLIDPGRGGARRWEVDFLAKYVRPDKQDGVYLPDVTGGEPVWNWYPSQS